MAINRLNLRPKNTFFDAYETPEQIDRARAGDAASRLQRAGRLAGMARKLATDGRKRMTPEQIAQNRLNRESYQKRIAGMPRTPAASAAARARWKKVGDDVRSRRAFLLQAVSAQYDAIDATLRIGRSNIGQEVATLIRYHVDSWLASPWLWAGIAAGKIGVAACHAGYLAVGMYPVAVGFLTWALVSSCGLMPQGAKAAMGKVKSKAVDSLAKLSSAIPTQVHPTIKIIETLPKALDWISERLIRTAAAWAGDRVSSMLNVADITAVKRAAAMHSDKLALVLHGHDVSLKPLFIDVAKSLNMCVVEGILAKMKSFKLPAMTDMKNCARM